MATMTNIKGPEKGMDRLSDLRDSLIHHILSFLDAKIVVQTCVLSKRWRYLWTCVPILNFHSHSFGSLTIFNKFVMSVLSRRIKREVSNLDGLKFNSDSCNKSVYKRVIQYAVSHSVQEITMQQINIRPCSSLSLNNELLLSCVTLKSLHLQSCTLSHDLFSSCMHLETLTLDGCFIDEEERIQIYAPRLVKLSIVKLNNYYSRSYLSHLRDKQELVVCCPRLSNFIYEGRYPRMISMEECPVHDKNNDIVINGPFSRSRDKLNKLLPLLQKSGDHLRCYMSFAGGGRIGIEIWLEDIFKDKLERLEE